MSSVNIFSAAAFDRQLRKTDRSLNFAKSDMKDHPFRYYRGERDLKLAVSSAQTARVHAERISPELALSTELIEARTTGELGAFQKMYNRDLFGLFRSREWTTRVDELGAMSDQVQALRRTVRGPARLGRIATIGMAGAFTASVAGLAMSASSGSRGSTASPRP